MTDSNTVPDGTKRTLRQLWNETAKEPLPADILKRLSELQ